MPFRTKNCHEIFFANNCFKFFCFSLMLFAFLNIYIFLCAFSQYFRTAELPQRRIFIMLVHIFPLLIIIGASLQCINHFRRLSLIWTGFSEKKFSRNFWAPLEHNFDMKMLHSYNMQLTNLLIDWISRIDTNLLQARIY